MLKKIEKALTIGILGAVFLLPGLALTGGSIWVMLTHGGSPVGVLLSGLLTLILTSLGIEEIKDLKD